MRVIWMMVVLFAIGCGEQRRDPPVTGSDAGTPVDAGAPKDAGESLYCPPKVPGCCKKATNCGENRFEWICTSTGSCDRLCVSSSDCGPDQVCEDAFCRPLACGSDSECENGQQCLGGACTTPIQASAIATCQVLPTRALLASGTRKTFSVITRDASGATLAFKGDATWTVDEPARASVSDAVVTGGATEGLVEVRARIGSVTCQTAEVVNFAPVSDGKLRVVLADLDGQALIEGATVVLDEGVSVATNALGSAEFADVSTGPHTVSVFHPEYAWVTVVDTASSDLLLFTRRARPPARFTGHMSARSFDNLSNEAGTAHLAMHGSSLAGNLFDINLETLLGKKKETEVDLGSQTTTVAVETGSIIGLGEQMYREEFFIDASPGVRTLWGLGGNAALSVLTEALGPAISGSADFNLSKAYSKLLPMIGRLQSAALTGVRAVPGEENSLDDATGLSRIRFDTLLRVRLHLHLPDLPSFKMDDVETPFQGAVVLGGAHYGAQGFVPLGMTAGLDDDGDGPVDADELAGTEEGTLAMRIAPRHSGLEGSPSMIVAIAKAEMQAPGNEEEPRLVHSALVTFPSELGYNEGRPTNVNLGDSFLDVPDDASVVGRTLTPGTPVPEAVFQRLSIGGVDDAEWLVYFPPGATITLPEAPAGQRDRLLEAVEGNSLPRVLLHSVRLGDSDLTFDDVVSFGSHNLDDLSMTTDAFSVIELDR